MHFPHQKPTFEHSISSPVILVLRELEDRLDQKQLLPPVLALENLIVNAANGL